MAIIRKSRREFLKSGGSIASASWMAINMPLIVSAAQTAAENSQAGVGFKNITIEESVEFNALVNQIIPPDETPGAAEIGVVYFIDVALGSFMSGAAPGLRQGLEEFQQKTKSAYPEINRFSDLAPDKQTEMLRSVEDSPFFGTLYFMTLSGMFCLPSYAGNRNNAGWDLVGFDHRHAWQPPFGYYDAAAHGQVPPGENDDEHV